jgi:AAA15 family ATPase/GTPase
MGYQFRWKNFRGFEDTQWIRLRPVTVFIGPNNSGKTSLIAPLLILKQSYFSSERLPALQLKGNQINAGDYKDIVLAHDLQREIELSFRFHHHEFEKGETVRALGKEPPGEIEVSFGSNGSTREIHLKRFTL